MTKVVNKYKEEYDVYIGRGSKWGNPFSHLKDSKAEVIVQTREQSIALYRNFLIDCISDETITLDELIALDGKRLGCYCKPKACHGDVIVELIEIAKRSKNGSV